MAEENVKINLSSFVTQENEKPKYVISYDANEVNVIDDAEPVKKKRASRKKSSDTTKAIAIPEPQTSMSYLQENIPYTTAYNETNRQLDESIAQLNVLGGELMNELQTVRASKTLKNKYNYINDMTMTVSNIIGSKITAIREKNKTIDNINRLELTRMKELKTTLSQEDDNTHIANLYNAFISTPIGSGAGALAPPMQDMMMTGADPSLSYIPIGGNDQAAWEQNLDPAQNRMVLEARGAIETVVVYDESTGNRWFEVVDRNTRQPVPNVEKPDSSYIYDLDINIRGGFAKDSNRNTVYPLIVMSSDNGMSQF